MNANTTFNRQRTEKPGCFAIAIECADGLTNDEINRMEAVKGPGLPAAEARMRIESRGSQERQILFWGWHCDV